MSVSLSTTVMAHRLRESFVDELQPRLGHVDVVWDRYNDRWDTGSRAMLAGLDYSRDYHMVVQDDAIICRDLIPGVQRILDHLSGRGAEPTPLCLYIGHKYREAERLSTAPSWVHTTLGSGIAIVLPTRWILNAVKHGNELPDVDNYDIRLSHWLWHHGVNVWHPWPSIVDHRESPSLVPGRGSKSRQARRFIGQDASALDFDLTGTIATLPDRVFRSQRRIQQKGLIA